jgi:hypothetical protein
MEIRRAAFNDHPETHEVVNNAYSKADVLNVRNQEP